jgi:hypothetical protein
MFHKQSSFYHAPFYRLTGRVLDSDPEDRQGYFNGFQSCQRIPGANACEVSK